MDITIEQLLKGRPGARHRKDRRTGKRKRSKAEHQDPEQQNADPVAVRRKPAEGHHCEMACE